MALPGSAPGGRIGQKEWAKRAPKQGKIRILEVVARVHWAGELQHAHVVSRRGGAPVLVPLPYHVSMPNFSLNPKP